MKSRSERDHMRFKAVFLDVYLTLLEVNDIDGVYHAILRQHGCGAGREQVSEWIKAARTAVAALPSGLGPDHSIDATLTEARRDAQLSALLEEAAVGDSREACRAALRAAWTTSALFPIYEDVVGALDELKRQGLIIGAVSNWDARLTRLLAGNGIAEHFDFILASESEGFAKPSPRMFERALQRAGVDASQALHAGDDLVNDVDAARAAGITAVMVRRRREGPAQYSPAIESLDQLLPLVQAECWLSGRVVSGRRQAAAFTQLDWVQEQARAQLGFSPAAGTLNLRLETREERTNWEALRKSSALILDPAPGFCEAHCYPISVEGRYPGAIVWPQLPGYPSDMIEVLAPVQLREALPAEDGMRVTLAVL
jgi:HAD superfamily hydrolase (TIGR01549 family)